MLNKYIEENRNGDICLADCDIGAVIVREITGIFRFRYDGKTSSQNNDQFYTVGIATDSMANVLVSDSKKVHIIDMNGQLGIVCLNPLRLALDKDDNLYIADTTGNVKLVKYMYGRRELLFAKAYNFIKKMIE